MNIAHIVAYRVQDGGIGIRGRLLYNIREDQQHFRRVTDGHIVLMGRKTWESISKKPLPNRVNVVISKTIEEIPSAIVFKTITESLSWCSKTYPDKTVFVIGGQEIYRETFKYADTIIATEINDPESVLARPSDTFYPIEFLKYFKQDNTISSPEHEIYSIICYKR